MLGEKGATPRSPTTFAVQACISILKSILNQAPVKQLGTPGIRTANPAPSSGTDQLFPHKRFQFFPIFKQDGEKEKEKKKKKLYLLIIQGFKPP